MKYKTCSKCKLDRPETEYIKGNSPFLPGGYSIVCTPCLEKMVPSDDLAKVDQLMRWLDIPFYFGQWTQLQKLNKEHTLRAYAGYLASNGEQYDPKLGWKELNDKWLHLREKGDVELEREIPEMDAAWVGRMKKKWPGKFIKEDYESLEDLHSGIIGSFNVITPTQADEAKKLCRIAHIIDKKIENGEDVSKDVKTYLDLKKAGGFETKDAKTLTDFDSVGEVFVYMGKKGFQPSFATEKKDVVDMTMHNTQEYLRRLVMNESSLADQVEKRKEAYDLSKRLEEDYFSEEQFKKYEEVNLDITFEGSEDLDTELDKGEFYE